MQVKIYSKSNCSYCKKTKEWFQSHKIPYEETVLDDYQERQDFYQRVSNGVGAVDAESCSHSKHRRRSADSADEDAHREERTQLRRDTARGA